MRTNKGQYVQWRYECGEFKINSGSRSPPIHPSEVSRWVQIVQDKDLKHVSYAIKDFHENNNVEWWPSPLASLYIEDLDEVKNLDIKGVVAMDEVPPELIINRDQTGLNHVPVSSCTMA